MAAESRGVLRWRGCRVTGGTDEPRRRTHRQARVARRGRGALSARRYRFTGYDTEVGPLGHLHAERERLAGLTWEHFDARPLGATIGAELRGISTSPTTCPTTSIAEIRQALLDYKVLFFRDQHLTARSSTSPSPAASATSRSTRSSPRTPAHPELVRFEKSADVGGYENGWHSDVTWRAEPVAGRRSCAPSRCPPSGGDTLFADMDAVYEGLDDDLQARIDGLIAMHDFTHVFGRTIDGRRAGARCAQKYPPVEHPVVRTHPETGPQAALRQPLLRGCTSSASSPTRATR